MPVVALTVQYIKGIKPPTDKPRKEYTDALTEGLKLRVTKSGVFTWSLRYWPEGGSKYERVTAKGIGKDELAKARTWAARLRGKIVDGENPQETRRRKRQAAANVLTFDKLADQYIADAKTRKASWNDDKERLVRPRKAFGDREAASITRREIITFLDDVRTVAPVQANRIQTALSVMFNWAVDGELMERNVLAGLRRRHKEEAPKERTLTPAEVRVLWHALETTRKPRPMSPPHCASCS